MMMMHEACVTVSINCSWTICTVPDQVHRLVFMHDSIISPFFMQQLTDNRVKCNKIRTQIEITKVCVMIIQMNTFDSLTQFMNFQQKKDNTCENNHIFND